MGDEDSDEELGQAAVVSFQLSLFVFFVFVQYSPKSSSTHLEWLSGAFLVSFFLIPLLYKLTVLFSALLR